MKTIFSRRFNTRIIVFSVITAATACLPKMAAGQGSQYQAIVQPANIAPTSSVTAATAKVEVIGQPRITKGHPCTLWDNEDIAHYKDMLRTSTTLKEQFAKLKADMDKRITEPLGVPEPKKGPDGKWLFLGDQEPFKGKTGIDSYFGRNGKLSRDISDLGTIHALTGDAKYGEFAKKILLAYAENYSKYGFPQGTPRYRSAQDGRLKGQFLEDGGWLIQAGFGYDLIYNLPSWKPEEREKIHKDLFNEIVNEWRTERFKGITYLNDPNNRSAVYAAATLIAGYGTEDQVMINDGLYGTVGTKEKPTGGVFGAFFTPQCISPDGLWTETIGYQISIAGSALINHAEVLWHHGIDMYRYKNCVLKRIFDTPIEFAYPDADISIPETGDTTSRLPISVSGDAVIYEYAYRRYANPLYLPIVEKVKKSLSLSSHQAPPSFLYDLNASTDKTASVRKPESINFFDNGLGLLRLQAAEGINQLIMMYGISRSHGHPDKLSIDLFGLGDVLAPDPGVIFPYQDPLDPAWYSTTFSHCTLTVDEQSQISFGNLYKFKGAANPDAQQLVYGPASTMGIQRAWTKTSYPGISMDRAVFLTSGYLADIFGAFSQGPHKYDLAWHLRGQLTSDLPFQPMKFPEPVADGYKALSDTRQANTNKAWSATFSRNGKDVRLLAAGGIETEVFTGVGHYRGAIGYSGKDEFPPMIFERRTKEASTIFGNALDISGIKGGYIKSVTQGGSLEQGYGLLSIETAKGTDLCFVSYRPGSYKAAGLETDSQQAFVLMDGKNVQAMYLGGGNVLRTATASLERSEPGLAYIEKLDTGNYILSNPSPTTATVTVTVPGLARLSAFTLDANGKRTGPATVTKGGLANMLCIQLPAASKVEFGR